MSAYASVRRWRVTLVSGLLLSALPQAPAIAGFTVTDAASPATIQAGQTEQLTATVTTVYNHTGWSGTQVVSQSYTNLTFTGGVPVTETWNWPVPAAAAPGTYTLVASAFDNDGNFLLSATTTFSVTGGTVVNGQCGSANRALTNVMPNTNLCNAGTASAVTGTGPWFWTCAGSGGGTMASCATAYASCPKGTTYVSVGDGCQNASPTGTVQHTNFFTSYIPGTSYVTRPPWNVAGVDYAVGYDGATLKDPSVKANQPACMTVRNSYSFLINGDVQPCVIDHFDFTLNGGYCLLIEGTSGSTVTFTNNKFGTTSALDCYGFVYEIPGAVINVTFNYNQVNDNYTSNFPNVLYLNTNGPNNVTIEYNAFYELSCRVINQRNGTATFKYNLVDGIGENTAGCHGEVDEYGGTGTMVVTHKFNTYYLHPNDATTAIIYISNSSNDTTSADVEYNTLIARKRTGDGYNPTISEIYFDTTQNKVIPSAIASNNYEDAGGAWYWPAYVYPPDSGTGYIGSGSTCMNNISLTTGASIPSSWGSTGKGTSTLVCK